MRSNTRRMGTMMAAMSPALRPLWPACGVITLDDGLGVGLLAGLDMGLGADAGLFEEGFVLGALGAF